MSVAERANTTFPVKFRAKETGFVIMESRSITHWKRNIPTAVKCMRKENEQIDTSKPF